MHLCILLISAGSPWFKKRKFDNKTGKNEEKTPFSLKKVYPIHDPGIWYEWNILQMEILDYRKFDGLLIEMEKRAITTLHIPNAYFSPSDEKRFYRC